MSINKVILVGNLGADPQLRATASKRPVCDFSIATSRTFAAENETPTTRTEWHNIVCFGVLAETCAKYLHKGRQIFVEGRIQSQKWKDKDGEDRYSHQVVANVIQFLGSKPKRDSDPDSNAETFVSQAQDEACDDIPW